MDKGIQTLQWRGHSIEAADVNGTIYVTIDGVEKRKTFPSLLHAMDFAKHKVDIIERRGQQRTGFDVSWWQKEGFDRRFAAMFEEG